MRVRKTEKKNSFRATEHYSSQSVTIGYIPANHRTGKCVWGRGGVSILFVALAMLVYEIGGDASTGVLKGGVYFASIAFPFNFSYWLKNVHRLLTHLISQ